MVDPYRDSEHYYRCALLHYFWRFSLSVRHEGLTESERRALRIAGQRHLVSWTSAISDRELYHLLTDDVYQILMGCWRKAQGAVSPAERALLWPVRLYLFLSKWLYARGEVHLACCAVLHALSEDPAWFHGSSEMASWVESLRDACPRGFDEAVESLPGADFRGPPPRRVELVDDEDFSYLGGLRNPRLFDELQSSGLLEARNRIRAGEPLRSTDKLALMISSLDQPGRRYPERIEDRPADGQQCRDWRKECENDPSAFDDSYRAWLERHLRDDDTGRCVKKTVARSEKNSGKHYWHCKTCTETEAFNSWVKERDDGGRGPICRKCVRTRRPPRLDWHEFGLVHLPEDERFSVVPLPAHRASDDAVGEHTGCHYLVELLWTRVKQLRALDGYYYHEFRDLGTRMAPVTQFEVQESARAFLMKTSAVEMDRSCTCAW